MKGMRFLARAAGCVALLFTVQAHALGGEWRVLRGAVAETVLSTGEGREALERVLAEFAERFPAVAARVGGRPTEPFAGWLGWSRALSSEERGIARSMRRMRELEETVAAIEQDLARAGLEAGGSRALSPERRRAALARAESLFGARRIAFLSGEARPAAEPSIEAAHGAIVHDLFHGEVIHSEPFAAAGNQTRILKVRVRNPLNGRIREALFKPRPWGDGDGWNRTTMEYVAYELNRMLGMDHVPPVAYRRNIRAGSETYPEGALIYLVPDAHDLRAVARAEWGDSPRLLLSDARILDTLLQNPDRHVRQFIRGRHWVDGTYRPVLIDHAASLRPHSRTHLGHDDAFAMGPVRVIRHRTWEALIRLDRTRLERLSEFLSPREIEGILERRDLILREIEGMSAERGFRAVVFP